MPLVEIEISNNGSVLPDEIVTFLREADLRVSQFLQNSPLRATGFIPQTHTYSGTCLNTTDLWETFNGTAQRVPLNVLLRFMKLPAAEVLIDCYFHQQKSNKLRH